MATPYKLRDLEAAHGDLHKIIPTLVNKGGQQYAAGQLGVSISTISTWLKENNYVQRVEYVRKELAS